MRTRAAAIITLILFFVPVSAFPCSCSNSTPIQKSSRRYTSPEDAVFTAHVVQLIGKIYIFDGKRSSSRALAIVHERYWGLPWYWPKVVLLDGSYPCDTVMFEGEEYLVAGRKERYGVLSVNLCSRTQPLKTALIDLRTLDGTHCAAPGGTIVGHVRGEWDSSKREYRPVRVGSIALSDLSGKVHRANVDNNGIYELQHLPPVLYAPISRLDAHRYISSAYWDYRFTPLSHVPEGICEERDLTVYDYGLTGRLLPGIGRSVNVELIDVKAGSKGVRADSIEPDGRFYFHKPAPGTYVLSVVPTIGDRKARIFYPGVADRAKATSVVINGGKIGRSYDFDARVLPVVPIPVVLDPVVGSDKLMWDFQLVEGDQVISVSRADRTNIGLVYGMKGGSYRLQLYGYPRDPLKENYCTSESLPVTAAAGAAPVHLTARCARAVR